MQKPAFFTLVLSSVLTWSACAQAANPQSQLRLAAQWPKTAACEAVIRLGTQSQELTEGAFNTDSMIIWKNGVEMLEFYDGVFKPQSAHALWSASKTITATLIGSAIQQGKLRLSDRVADYISLEEENVFRSEQDKNNFNKMTIANLVTMSSGFAWKERYEAGIQESSVLEMLYGRGKNDVVGYALSSLFTTYFPDLTYNYSSGNSNILQKILRKVYGAEYDQMPWSTLFNKVGATKAVMEQDPSGTFVGSSHVHMTTQDFLKLGILFYNNGVVQLNNGRKIRVLPADWRAFMTSVSPGMLSETFPASQIAEEDVYGGGVWLNRDVRGVERPFPLASEDLFMAAGHYGQLLIVIPSKKIVIARFGHDSEYWSKLNQFISGVESCLQ